MSESEVKDPRNAVALTACRGARMASETFTAPDDDWEPVLVMMGKEGAILNVTVGDVPEQLVQPLIEQLCRESQALAIARVGSAWYVEREAHELDTVRRGDARRDPNRQETLIVMAYNGEGTVAWMAKVTRSPNRPPELGEWELHENVQTDGGDAIVSALRGSA